MEKTKSTIRLPRHLLDGARRYASERNTTLTRLVSEYLRQLGAGDDPLGDAPVVRRLSGIIPQDAIVEDYRRHQEARHDGQAQRLD